MPHNILVRPASNADIPALDDMLYRAFDELLRPDYPAEVLYRAVPMMGRARRDLVGSDTYFVATDESGRILGAGGWANDDPHGGEADPRVGHIRHFGVDPSVARRGVARAIMDHVLRDAADKGIEKMNCFSTFSAVPFYRAMGFAVLDELDIMLTEDVAFPAVVMLRRLP
jgi:GNAT superfamily N-acetyltransferase